MASKLTESCPASATNQTISDQFKNWVDHHSKYPFQQLDIGMYHSNGTFKPNPGFALAKLFLDVHSTEVGACIEKMVSSDVYVESIDYSNRDANHAGKLFSINRFHMLVEIAELLENKDTYLKLYLLIQIKA